MNEDPDSYRHVNRDFFCSQATCKNVPAFLIYYVLILRKDRGEGNTRNFVPVRGS